MLLLSSFPMSDTIPQPQRKRWYKRWWIWVCIVLVVCIAGGTVAGKNIIQSQRLSSLAYLKDNVTAKTRDIRKTISTTGTVVPDEQVSLATSGTGTVMAVNVSVGQEVSKGDVLLTIDPDLPGVSKNVEATFDGRILTLSTFVGDRVSPAIPVVEVAYRSNHIEFYASDTEAIELQTGQSVDMTVPSFENGKTIYTGQVSFVDVKKRTAAATSLSQTGQSGFLVKISTGDLPTSVSSIIGLTVDMTIITAERTGVLSIENAAVQYTDTNTPFIYLPVTVDTAFANRAAGVEDVTTLLDKKDITVGFEGDEYTEVTGGLTAGESVLFYVPAQNSSSPF